MNINTMKKCNNGRLADLSERLKLNAEELEKLNLARITQQRELLIAFSKKTIDITGQSNITHEKIVDSYIKTDEICMWD